MRGNQGFPLRPPSFLLQCLVVEGNLLHNLDEGKPRFPPDHLPPNKIINFYKMIFC